MALINFSGNVGSKVKTIQAPSLDTNKKQQVNSTYESTNNIKENNTSTNNFYPIEMELNINKLKELKSEILKKQSILKGLETIIIEKENKLKELEMNTIENGNTIVNHNIDNPKEKPTSFIKKLKKVAKDFYSKIRIIIKKFNPFK